MKDGRTPDDVQVKIGAAASIRVLKRKSGWSAKDGQPLTADQA
jgi:hypothetical protein